VAVSGSQEEVHVFQGSVTLKTVAGPVQELQAGQARAVIDNAEPHAIPATPTTFAKAADLERKTVATHDPRQQVWQQAAARWHADPALLVHFDFAKDAISDRAIRNRATHGTAAGDGVMVGCAVVEGRWPSRQALAFRTESDRVRVQVPGEHHALTLITWVRVDLLERPFNSLFMIHE
jgi:hypothetical protein